MSKSNQEVLKALSAEMPYKWRVGQTNKAKDKCTVLAYVDARDVMNRLDEVLGPENWERKYKEIKGNIYCGIGVRFPDSDEFVWKWDCGSESNIEEEKGESSDAFKRAAVNFGVGRFLYDMDTPWFPFENGGLKDANGKRVWDVTEYVNDFLAKKGGKKKAEPAAEKPVKKEVKAEEEDDDSENDPELDKKIKAVADTWKKISVKEQVDHKVFDEESLEKIRANIKKGMESGEKKKVLEYVEKAIAMYEKKSAKKK